MKKVLLSFMLTIGCMSFTWAAIEIMEVIPATTGECDGAIEVIAEGNAGPFSVTLSKDMIIQEVAQNINGTYVFEDLCSGNYTITVESEVFAKLCSVELEAEITEEDCTFVADLTIVSIANVDKNCDGMIEIQIDSEDCGNCELRLYKDKIPSIVPNDYDNLIAVTDGAVATFSGLCEGTYRFAVYNADLMCYYYPEEEVIIEDCQLSITNIDTEDAPCGDEGSITIDINETNPPYFYKLNKGGIEIASIITDATIHIFEGYSSGTYSVQVTDDRRCLTASVATINGTDSPLSIDNVSTTSAECEFSNDGSITLEVSGGDGDYIYSWNTSLGSQSSFGDSPYTIEGLASGIYNITVSSAGCSAVTTAEVGVEQGGNCDPPMGNCDGFSVDLIHNCDKFITLTATPNEGTPPYTYLWTEDGVEIGTDSSIDAGAVGPALDNVQYCVEVSDSASLCTTNSCITAYEMYNNCYGGNGNSNVENRSSNVLSKFILTATPNPFDGNLSIVLSSPTNQQVTIDIIDINGRSIYQVELDLIKGENLKKIDASNWSSGIYQIVVREANGTMNVKKVVRID